MYVLLKSLASFAQRIEVICIETDCLRQLYKTSYCLLFIQIVRIAISKGMTLSIFQRFQWGVSSSIMLKIVNQSSCWHNRQVSRKVQEIMTGCRLYSRLALWRILYSNVILFLVSFIHQPYVMDPFLFSVIDFSKDVLYVLSYSVNRPSTP
jgi:hypothetical protein